MASSKVALLGEVAGRVLGHRDGHGFVVRDDGEPNLYLAPEVMRSVLHGDRVLARVVRLDRKGRPEGQVLDIVERRKAPIIGRLLHEAGHWLVAPEDRRFGQDVLIPKNATANATAGQVVSVELTEPPSLHAQPAGRVIEVLGEIDDPGIEIEIAVRKFEVPHRFSPETLAEAAALPRKVRAVDRRRRIDLRDVALVTIDGEDARDFDDAVYCEPCRHGRGRQAAPGWRLIVAIADVSHYVKPGQALDLDAYERATSVYFPRRVIPMLPERLSNGLCSLNPGEDRLAMVCDMVVSVDGQVQAYQFYPAVIHSHARLTYTEAAAALANTRGPEAQRLAPCMPNLLALHEVYRALLQHRDVRGAMEFETTETQIVCDAQGRIERIVPRTRNEAHRLIEEAMLAANTCAADFIQRAGHPSLYRVHEGPTPAKQQALQAYLRSLGLGLHLSDEPAPAELQAIAKATRDRADARQIHTMLLRSMQQAVYTASNAGHFGLAYEAYTHFTSPIRRYPDLLVHRVIKALLGSRRYQLTLASTVGEGESDERRPGRASVPPALRSKAKAEVLARWEQAGAHCSANERRADEASRDVEAWLKCRYMRDRLGEEFAGTVSAATAFGIFVTLDELYVEGLVHISELGGDYYRFDEVRQELRGERSGERYAIGTRVRVQVSRVDLDSRRIDFRLVREVDENRLLAAGRSTSRGRPGAVSALERLEAIEEVDRTLKPPRAKAGKGKARKSVKTTPRGAEREAATGRVAAGRSDKTGKPAGRKGGKARR